MNSSQYIEAFNEIKLTPNLEAEILKNIFSDNISLSKQKIKKKWFLKYALLASCLCIAIAFIMTYFFTPELSCDLLSDKSLKSLDGISQIERVSIESSDKTYIDSLGVKRNTMIILDNDKTVEEGNKITFAGKVQGDDIDCEIGYILNGDYQNINNTDNSNVEISVTAPESGIYYWCILNYSKKEIEFNGSLTMNSNDLVYRNYGDDVIKADINTTFIIHNIGDILESYEVEGIYAYNCATATLFNISSKITDMEYKAQEAGYYVIYAVTQDGKRIDLNQYVTVEVEYPDDEAIIEL